jgi:hypothetical protein
VKVEP